MSEDKVKREPKITPQRLATFRGLRDLTLGSTVPGNLYAGPSNSRDKQRKSFTPNVNVQRKKHQEIVVKNEFSKTNDRRNHRGGRGRGRGRGTTNLVQASPSIFSEGIASSGTVFKRTNYDTARVKDEVLQMPKLNLKLNCKVDKAEEDRKLKELLRDDFLDDGDLAPDTSFAPLSLPFRNPVKKANQDTKVKVEVKPSVKEIVIDGVRIKQEVEEYPEDENELDLNMKLGFDPPQVKKEPQQISDDKDNLFLNGLLTTNERRLFLIQFPDRLPAFPPEPSGNSGKPNISTKGKTGQTTVNQESSSDTKKYCSLNDLAPGQIGHLQIRKSGKIELVLGKCVLNVSSGTSVSCQQDLVAVQLHPGNHCTGDTVELGPVESRLICTPDWNTLLKSDKHTK